MTDTLSYFTQLSGGLLEITLCIKFPANLQVRIHRLQVRIHELRVRIHELRVPIHELRVQIHQLRVQIHKSLNQ